MKNNIWCVYSGDLKPFLGIPNIFRETAIFQSDVSRKSTRSGSKTLYFHETSLWKIAVSQKLLGNLKNGLRSPE